MHEAKQIKSNNQIKTLYQLNRADTGPEIVSDLIHKRETLQVGKTLVQQHKLSATQPRTVVSEIYRSETPLTYSLKKLALYAVET